jgi:class 3 adenylate cyclase/tetratricopeptide (TPR) repeat protein
MMQCPRCQHENPPHAKFCLECGARFAVACAQCGTQLPAGAKFCLECGKPTDSHETEPARFASPQSYTPKHLAEKILTSRSALEGERKQVTVLFADLKGSMELLADRDPEEARKLLDPVLDRMMEAVHRYEGTVNQVMGDGIMALFGAPVAHEDHAVRACYAALDMQAAIRHYADEVRRSHGIKVQIRVGINSGEVVVRAIGSDLRMDYTAVGQTTHLAARMEQFADAGTTLLTADTLRLAEGFIEVKPLGPVPVKGLEAPIEIYEVVGAGPMRSRLHASVARGLTRFVGRESELEQLRQALARAASGHGQVVAIVGEPGVGKSRLVWEVTHSHRTHAWLIVQAGSVSYGKATPYLPVIDLLKGYFQIEIRDDHRRVREKVIGKLLNLDDALRPTLAAFLSLLDVPVEDPQWQSLDPPQRRQRTLEVVKRLLLRESQVQPLLVVFEDLHWIDGETQALLDTLVESVPTARLLLLVNYRPEYEHRWVGKTYYMQMRLDALSPESAEEFLQALMGVDPGLQPFKEYLIDRAERNPFFLEESVRSLVETHVLVGERGAYRLVRPFHSIQVPATVQAVLAARIDRLPPDEKSLLQTASVIGKDVPVALLQAIAELPTDTLHRGLAHLQAAEFFYETSFFPDPAYTFKHALTHEVAYGSLLQERRRLLHGRIVEATERLHSERLGEHVGRLAEHTFRAESWEKAVFYSRQAATRSLDRSAYAHALTCFDRALEALAHLPPNRTTLEQVIELRLARGAPYFVLGQAERQLANLEETLPLAEALGDPRWLALITCYKTNALWNVGDNTRALEIGLRALSLAETLGDGTILIRACLDLAQICRTIGDYAAAITYFERTIEALGASRDRLGRAEIPAVAARVQLAVCLADLGEFSKAAAMSSEALGIAEAVQHLVSLFLAHSGVGVSLLRQGQLDRAIPSLERAHALCESAGMTAGYPTAGTLGHAYTMAGRVTEALALIDQANISRHRRFEAPGAAYLAEAYFRAGRPIEATAAADRAVELARQRAERGTEARALHLLGEIASASAPVDVGRAEEHFEQALALADELGMRPLVAHCHLGLGKLYRQTSDRAKADEHLATATAMYREMEMGFWLEKAEAALGPPHRNAP